MAPQIVIDATKSHLQCLGPLTKWVCALKHLVPNWQGPCTDMFGSLSHQLAEHIEDPGDGPKALADYGESLDVLEKH